jgi:hypothetical protein
MWGYKIWVLAFPKTPMDTANTTKWKQKLEKIAAADAPKILTLFHLYEVVIGPGTEMWVVCLCSSCCSHCPVQAHASLLRLYHYDVMTVGL